MDLGEIQKASRTVWEAMARGWDDHREYIWESSKPVGEWLVEQLRPRRGQTMLELAAGLGDTGFIAAKLVGDEGRLISTDFAPSMVEGARRRARELGIRNAEFRVMDAEQMDLASECVDGALCRWGYMLMGDPGAALRETHRVLRPGGRLCFSVFATAEMNPWAALPVQVMLENNLMDPPPRGAPGILSLADEGRLRDLVEDAGFADPNIEKVPIVWRYPDFDAYWQFLTQIAGAIAARIERLPPEAQRTARAGIAEAVAPFRSGKELALPGVTLNVAVSKGATPGVSTV